MPKHQLAVSLVTLVFLSLAKGSVAQPVFPRASAGDLLLEREDADLAGRLSAHGQGEWRCDLPRGRRTSFEYVECQWGGGVTVRSPRSFGLLWISCAPWAASSSFSAPADESTPQFV